jgi:hypothetical protein
MTDHYLYNVVLPISKTKLIYRELNCKEQILLSKAHVMMPFTDENLEDYGEVLQNIISGCVKNKEDFFNLNLIEYFLFLTKLRITSIGEDLEIIFASKDNIKINLHLPSFNYNLYNLAKETLDNVSLTYKGYTVILDWPSIKSEKYFLSPRNKKNGINFILDSVPEYIKIIKVKEKCIDFKTFSEEEKKTIYDSLPAGLLAELNKIVLGVVDKVTSANVFKTSIEEYGRFNFYNANYQNYLRLFFIDDLKSLYRQYYILASKNIPPYYLDSLSVAEKGAFLSLYEEELEYRNGQSNQGTSTQHYSNPTGESSAVLNLAREFGDTAVK